METDHAGVRPGADGSARRRGLLSMLPLLPWLSAGLTSRAAVAARQQASSRHLRAAPAPVLPKELRIVHGFHPTTEVDVVSRALGARLRAGSIARVSVSHRTGGSGRRAASELRGQPGDDQLLLVTPGSVLTMLPHADRQPTYDPIADLAPVCLIGWMNLALAVGPSVPASVRSFDSFVAWCRWQHEAVLCGNAGFGSVAHFLTALLGTTADLPLEPLPYRSELASVRATAGGEVAAVLASEWAVLPYARAGRVRILATSGGQPSRFQDRVPTFVDAGYPMLERGDWLGAFMPAGVADARAWGLAEAIGEAVRESEVRDVLLRLSVHPGGGNPEGLARTLSEDHAFWGPVVQATGYTAGPG